MVLKNASYRIDDKILRELKRLAFEEDTTQTEIVNRYLIDGLKKDGIDIEKILNE